MPHISKFYSIPKTLEYLRKPTKSEIKFGHGAIHYRDFDFEKCFDEDGNQKLKVKASDDGLIYHYKGMEYFITSKLKYQILKV